MLDLTIKELFAKKWWILTSMLLACSVTVVHFILNPPLYRSVVEVYVVDELLDVDAGSAMNSASIRTVSLYHNATSTEMFDHLIGTFHLDEHLHVPETDRVGRAYLHKELAELIKVEITDQNGIAVHVADEDRAMAADLANAVHAKLLEMDSTDKRMGLERSLHVYEQVIDSTDQLATTRAHDMIRLAADLRDLREGSGQAGRTQRLVELEYNLVNLSARIAASNDDLLREKRKAASLLATVNEQGNNSIRLKTRAIEDVWTSPTLISIKWTLVVTLAAGAVAVLMILLILENRFTPSPHFPVDRG